MNLLKSLIRRAYPIGSIRRVLRGPLRGWKFVVAPGFGVYYAIGSKALHIDVLQDCIKPGHLVFDVGANRGHISLLLSQAVGKYGRVVAFEPVEELCSDLRRNLQLNNVSNVTINQTALGEQEGQVDFLYSIDASTQGKFASAEQGLVVEGAQRIQVRQSPLDAFTRKHGVPDFIKIDVEGAAGCVMRGAAETIAAKKSAIFIELHGPEEQAAVQSLLIDRGYRAEDCQGKLITNAMTGWHSPIILRPA